MPILEARGLTKRFGSVLANEDVGVSVERGEILAIVGENGAGKSTLMNMLYGLYTPDSGTILVRGVEVRFKNPRDAIRHGIGMVHQHFMLVPPLSIAENVVLGAEPTRWGLFHRAKAVRQVRESADRYGLGVDPEQRMRSATVGVQQKVEILKVLFRGAEIMILDEPTAVLAPQEIEELFAALRRLAAEGKSVLLIAHKLREVLSVADRVAVMRGGRLVATQNAASTNEAELTRLMIGADAPQEINEPKKPGRIILEVQTEALSFQVRAGEILGVAGVEGNGQSQLAEALTGLRAEGQVRVGGRRLRAEPGAFRQAGVAHIPEDRQKRGLALSMTVAENMSLGYHREAPFARGPWIDEAGRRGFANESIATYSIRTPGAEAPVRALSGGNQQKVIVARELAFDPQVVVAVQPTRGLDIGAMTFVHRQLREQRARGKAIVLISLDLDEILALSDRILVMYRGRVASAVSRGEVTKEKLGLWMLGGEKR